MSVIVCQRGARRRYSVPRLLYELGLLTALYTDSCDVSLLGSLGRLAPVRPPALRRLLNRRTQGIPSDLVRATDRPFVQGIFGRELDFSRDCIEWGLRDSKCVYSMFGSELDFLRYARDAGRKILIDVIIDPRSYRIVEEEAKQSSWHERDETRKRVKMEPHLHEVFAVADCLLCPCKSVAEGVHEFDGSLTAKTHVIPYGNSLQIRERTTSPTKGRVLLVGTDPLRKGVQYFAQAASRLKRRLPTAQFIVAGMGRREVQGMPYANEVEFLGRLPMSEIRREFERADVFCLPSLCEGQAGAILEALSVGCPVVATQEAGVDFRDMNNGVLVPPRDPETLADRIELVLRDRRLHSELSNRGQILAREEFSEETWRKRISSFLTQFLAC